MGVFTSTLRITLPCRSHQLFVTKGSPKGRKAKHDTNALIVQRLGYEIVDLGTGVRFPVGALPTELLLFVNSRHLTNLTHGWQLFLTTRLEIVHHFKSLCYWFKSSLADQVI